MPKLEAVKEIKYGGAMRKPGETFDVLDKDVKILKAIGKAKDVVDVPKTQRPPEPVVEARRSEATEQPKEATEPKPEPVVTTAMTAEENEPLISQVRRGYRRRDMKPEG